MITSEEDFSPVSGKSKKRTRINDSHQTQLWKMEESTLTVVENYLLEHDIGEEDPLLVIDWLPQIEKVWYNLLHRTIYLSIRAYYCTTKRI
jgi:hypothetical protein